MNNKWLVGSIIIVIVVLVVAVAIGAYVFAQWSGGPRVAFGPGYMMGYRGVDGFGPGMMGMMNGRGGTIIGSPNGMMGGFVPGVNSGVASQNSLVAIAAKDLDVNVTDLITQLQGGKSVAGIAKEKNVSTDKIVDDFVAARSSALKSAVDSKQITQAQADAMLALAKANAQAQITRQSTSGAFGNRQFGGQTIPMVRGGFGAGGMMGPGRGIMSPYGAWR